MGSLSLLQRIFLTRNQTMVSCIAGGYFPTELSGKPKIKNKTSLKRTKFITPKDAKVMQSIHPPSAPHPTGACRGSGQVPPTSA